MILDFEEAELGRDGSGFFSHFNIFMLHFRDHFSDHLGPSSDHFRTIWDHLRTIFGTIFEVVFWDRKNVPLPPSDYMVWSIILEKNSSFRFLATIISLLCPSWATLFFL